MTAGLDTSKLLETSTDQLIDVSERWQVETGETSDPDRYIGELSMTFIRRDVEHHNISILS